MTLKLAEGCSPATCFEEELEPEGVLWLHALETRESTGSMAVTVLNAKGRPWPGVEVELVGFDLRETKTTDGRGQCRWETLRATEYTLNVRSKPKEGNFEKDPERLNQRNAWVKAGEETHIVFGERMHSGSLSVEIVDGLNRPQADAKVFLRGTLETYPATTDKRGRAKFEGVAPESYCFLWGRRVAGSFRRSWSVRGRGFFELGALPLFLTFGSRGPRAFPASGPTPLPPVTRCIE